MRFVVDASVVLASFLGEERADDADRVLDQVRTDSCVVPGHWRLEIGNVLTRDFRRRRLSHDEVLALARNGDRLQPEVDVKTDQAALGEIVRLSLKYALTAYDAAYLELALRENLALATFDRPLADAALAEGVSLMLPKVASS
jgi:predicted nucleic acid-binding protein